MGEMTRELVRDPCEIVFSDGKRYATQKWVTCYDDWRDTPIGPVNFGWTHIGRSFPTPDSVASPMYTPPRRCPLRHFKGKK